MDDPNVTIEEYIKLGEEKARRSGQVFNWQTATYGKIRIDDDLHDLSSVEAEFPAIVINDAFAPQDALQCKSHCSFVGTDTPYLLDGYNVLGKSSLFFFVDQGRDEYSIISLARIHISTTKGKE
ncbi:hypothetical protein Tco_0447849 [Tanacetum coccineum]